MADTEKRNTQRPRIDSSNQNLSIDDILNNANIQVNPTTPVSIGTASDSEVLAVVDDILNSKKLTVNETNRNIIKCAIAELAQSGATSNKFAESRKSSYSSIEVSVLEIRNACKRHNLTIRKIARNLRDIIIKVARKFDIIGNLARGYQLENPQASREELYWASDFQTFKRNDLLPDSVKEYLIDNYQTRFGSRNN